MKTISPLLKSRSIDSAKFSFETRPNKMRFMPELIIILKNWLNILLRLICEGNLYSNIYGMCQTRSRLGLQTYIYKHNESMCITGGSIFHICVMAFLHLSFSCINSTTREGYKWGLYFVIYEPWIINHQWISQGSILKVMIFSQLSTYSQSPMLPEKRYFKDFAA